MRVWIMASLAVGLAGLPETRADEPPASPPPLQRLATPGPLFLISTESGAARCEQWNVVPAEAGHGQLVRSVSVDGEVGTEEIEYLSAGGELTMTGRNRRFAGRDTMMGCEVRLPATALADAIAVGDSRWFVERAGCVAALAQRARVATDLTGCELGRVIPAAVARATKRRFERLLRRGGVAYVDEEGRCEAFQVTPAKRQRPGMVAGRFWSRIVVDGTRGTQSAGYVLRLDRDELTMMGSGASFEDGTGYGMGCARRTRLHYERQVVHALRALYLTRAACRAAVAAQQLHDAWLPVVLDEADPDDDELEPDAPDAEPLDAPQPDEADSDLHEDLSSTGFSLGSC